MADYSDFFIAVYTHECKGYCDKQFFTNLLNGIGNAQLHVVDNSVTPLYTEMLKLVLQDKAEVDHIEVSRDDRETLFHRNVSDSVNHLRRKFLKTNCKYFVIVESDVIPPTDFLDSFLEVIDQAEIIGGIYYVGFHSKEEWSEPKKVFLTGHCLSGCTLYKREVLEALEFRWDRNALNAFSDAFMSFDAITQGMRLINYSKIKCQHLEKNNSPIRGRDTLT